MVRCEVWYIDVGIKTAACTLLGTSAATLQHVSTCLIIYLISLDCMKKPTQT